MSNVLEKNDKYAFHPGYYIAEIIDDMEITQAEFAQRMGTTPKTLSKLVNGEANISRDLAKKLSSMLGTSVELWLNLQNTYDKKLIEIELEQEREEQKELLSSIDYNYFVKVADLPYERMAQDKLARLCNYLCVSDLRIMKEPDYLADLSSISKCSDEKSIVNSAAWIQTALNCVSSAKTEEYNATKLKAILPFLRSMTILEPDTLIARLKDLLASCGIIFLLLPPLKNSCVDVVVKWINGDRCLLAMSDCGYDTDSFWNAFFIAISHVLKHKVTMTYVSNIDSSIDEDAERFARDLTIPPSAYKKLLNNKTITDEDIIVFAESIGIHPGIVAGRLHRDGLLSGKRCSKMKEKYKFCA